MSLVRSTGQAINIIESESNSNGNWIKFSDGSLIQYGVVSMKADQDRSAGGLTYYSNYADGTINLPIAFSNNNYIAFTNIQIANMNYFCQSYAANSAPNRLVLSFASTGKDETRNIQWFAIGKWK